MLPPKERGYDEPICWLSCPGVITFHGRSVDDLTASKQSSVHVTVHVPHSILPTH
jgi:hypothetical protein